MDKKDLSERDICTKFIHEALRRAGWDLHEKVFEEYPLTKGPVIVRGKHVARGQRKRADYVLFHKPNQPLAIIEAKDNKHSVRAGMQQALEYAELLDVPVVFSSNGDGFLAHDLTGTRDPIEEELTLDQFPSPDELWRRYCAWKGITEKTEPIVTQDYYSDGSDKTPRYYQWKAINRTVEAIARGDDRILLVLATGTGKTFTAFQIIWRLWKARVKKRILFLADRNILVDQTMVNDFRPFRGAMAKLSTRTKSIERVNEGLDKSEQVKLGVDKRTKKVDRSYEIYLSLYQAVSGAEEERNIYKQFSPDFFDLIVGPVC